MISGTLSPRFNAEVRDRYDPFACWRVRRTKSQSDITTMFCLPLRSKSVKTVDNADNANPTLELQPDELYGEKSQGLSRNPEVILCLCCHPHCLSKSGIKYRAKTKRNIVVRNCETKLGGRNEPKSKAAQCECCHSASWQRLEVFRKGFEMLEGSPRLIDPTALKPSGVITNGSLTAHRNKTNSLAICDDTNHADTMTDPSIPIRSSKRDARAKTARTPPTPAARSSQSSLDSGHWSASQTASSDHKKSKNRPQSSNGDKTGERSRFGISSVIDGDWDSNRTVLLPSEKYHPHQFCMESSHRPKICQHRQTSFTSQDIYAAARKMSKTLRRNSILSCSASEAGNCFQCGRTCPAGDYYSSWNTFSHSNYTPQTVPQSLAYDDVGYVSGVFPLGGFQETDLDEVFIPPVAPVKNVIHTASLRKIPSVASSSASSSAVSSDQSEAESSPSPTAKFTTGQPLWGSTRSQTRMVKIVSNGRTENKGQIPLNPAYHFKPIADSSTECDSILGEIQGNREDSLPRSTAPKPYLVGTLC